MFISGEGWARGSYCNNTHLGNIWTNDFFIPTEPDICKMIVCTDINDQKITKFD